MITMLMTMTIILRMMLMMMMMMILRKMVILAMTTTMMSTVMVMKGVTIIIPLKRRLFQFNEKLHAQIDGVAMGSPSGPFMANAFMCFIEEKLALENKLPSFYKRYVDGTLALVRDHSQATAFLTTLNKAHPSIQ